MGRSIVTSSRPAFALRVAAVIALIAVLLASTGAPALANSEPAASAIVRNFPAVKQWYSLSCEYAAAAAVTLYWGKLVSQNDFMAEIPVHPNPHVGFRGDIHGKWGGTVNYGIYAEPLVAVLEKRGYNVDVFYGGVERLKSELTAGNPVVVWMTGKRGSFASQWETYEGKRFKLVPYEHATVAYGYDRDGIWIMDVGDGKRYYYGWNNFITRWNFFGQMSLVMTPGWE